MKRVKVEGLDLVLVPEGPAVPIETEDIAIAPLKDVRPISDKEV